MVQVKDEDNTLREWLAAPRPGGGPPPGFVNRSPQHEEALDRLRAWTRRRFRLTDEAPILVAEVACGLPGCPPLETVVMFWTGEETRHRFKVFKPVQQVVEDDLPYAWLKEALIDDGSGFECC
jgi:nitrate reductase delta subunit